MKKLILFLSPCVMVGMVEAKNLTVKTNADDIAIVEKYIPDAAEWSQQAWDMKVANSKESIIKEYVNWCMKNNKPIPSTEAEILKAAIRDLPSRKEQESQEEQLRRERRSQ